MGFAALITEPCRRCLAVQLPLASLEARVGLVDHVNAALAAHDAAVLVTELHRLERMTDLHGPYSTKNPGRAGANSESARKIGAGPVAVNPLFSPSFSRRRRWPAPPTLPAPCLHRPEFPNDLKGLRFPGPHRGFYSSGSVVKVSGWPPRRPRSVASDALVSAISRVKTATTQAPRWWAVSMMP